MTTLVRWHLVLVVIVASSLSWACGADSDAEEEEAELPEVDCPATPPEYAEVEAFKAECVSCHSSKLSGRARNDAPDDINFDSESAANASAELAAHEVFEGAMPPEDSGLELTNEKKQQLYEWALCM